MPQYIYLAASLSFAAALVKVIIDSTKSSRVYPPGPPADPVIGHVRIFPVDYQWKTFAEWGRKFGGMVYVHALGKPILVINSVVAARELLEKRGANYSDRPKMIFFEMMYWGSTLVCLPYGERWRKQRKLISQHFSPTAITKFRPMVENEVSAFLRRLESTPGKFKSHIHRLFSSTLLMATYGHPVTTDNDPYVTMIEHAVELLIAYGNPGGMLVDFLPSVRYLPTWFPGMGWKRHALKTKKVIEKMVTLPYDEVKRERMTGSARPSLISFLQDEYEEKHVKNQEHEEDIKLIGGMVYSAGVETSESSLQTFFLFISLYPEVAKRAQAELGSVLGGDRLPTFAERTSLPYIDCIIKETLRVNSPAPLGIPHCATKEDSYDGKYIPAGSMVIPNVWQMMRDESIFPDAERYNPDRFLSTVKAGDYTVTTGKTNTGARSAASNELDEAISDSLDDPNEVVFGFGRRVCPGRYLAIDSLWLTIASVLAVFDVLPPLDPITGKEIIQKPEFTSGVTIAPKPYEVRIVPRSDKHRALVKELRWDEVEA